MVRVNLVNPKFLTDQHLIAEYAEMLMLITYIKQFPENKNIPEKFTLKTGHMRFFKDKVLYLKKRHAQIREEMKKRGFIPKRTISLSGVKKNLMNNWKPNPQDLQLIKIRIKQKILMKPEWYRYYGQHKSKKFLIELISQAKE